MKIYLILAFFAVLSYSDNLRTECSACKPETSKLISAVKAGFPVTFSSVWRSDHDAYRLDEVRVSGEPKANVGAWCSAVLDTNQWIQVSSLEPKYWTGVTTQGRSDPYDCKQWVKKYTVKYTLDGENWYLADDGKVFNGNSDETTKVTNEFCEPIYARTIRICPQEWNEHISMRFEAYFMNDTL